MLNMSTRAAWSRYAEIVTNNVTSFECHSPGRGEYEELESWVDLFTRGLV